MLTSGEVKTETHLSVNNNLKKATKWTQGGNTSRGFALLLPLLNLLHTSAAVCFSLLNRIGNHNAGL
jgi:hypothetical protein